MTDQMWNRESDLQWLRNGATTTVSHGNGASHVHATLTDTSLVNGYSKRSCAAVNLHSNKVNLKTDWIRICIHTALGLGQT
jgi:hypothetical protein